MSKIEIDPVVRRRIQPQFMARNGQLVSAQLQQDMASLVNFIARHRTKEYFAAGGDVVAPLEDKLWRFAGHIGPMAGAMVARIVMAPATQGTQTNNPNVFIELKNTSGVVIASGRAHFGYSFGLTPVEVPDEWGVATIGLDVSALRDTSFRATLTAGEEARPISCTVYEVAARPDTSNGYVDQAYAVGQPILDEDRKALQDLALAIYKRGLGPLIMFSTARDADAATQTAATYKNVVEEFGSVSGDPAGYTLDLSYMNRKTLTTIPVKVEVYSGMSAGTGSLRLVDSAGNAYATFSVSGAAAWQTPQTANLPADSRFYKIEHQGDGANTISTYAVSVYRYQS